LLSQPAILLAKANLIEGGIVCLPDSNEAVILTNRFSGRKPNVEKRFHGSVKKIPSSNDDGIFSIRNCLALFF
jgi:hypothetical protein